MAALTEPTKKNVPWSWDNNELANAAFQALKDAFTSVSILLHFNTDKEIVVKTDASDFVSAGIVSEYDN